MRFMWFLERFFDICWFWILYYVLFGELEVLGGLIVLGLLGVFIVLVVFFFGGLKNFVLINLNVEFVVELGIKIKSYEVKLSE